MEGSSGQFLPGGSALAAPQHNPTGLLQFQLDKDGCAMAQSCKTLSGASLGHCHATGVAHCTVVTVTQCRKHTVHTGYS